MCAWAFVACLFVFVFLLFLSVVYLFSSSLYLYSVQHFISNVNNAEGNNSCSFAQWGVLTHGDIPSSHRLWAQRPRRLRPLRDYWNDLPGGIRRPRYRALVLVWCRTRRWDHRVSALFTTVHSGARRTSGTETSLSLSWRKFVAGSVLFRTHKYGEIRFWTKFRFVSKTEIKSRPVKRANQDSPGRQKEQILAEVRTDIQKHEFSRPILTRSIQELNGII